MSALDVVKDGNRFAIVITEGPSAGMTVTTRKLKRDAVAFAAQIAGEPWGHLYPHVPAASEASDDALTRTVPAVQLAHHESERKRLANDCAAMKALLLDLNNEIVARFGRGGWAVLDEYRKRVAR